MRVFTLWFQKVNLRERTLFVWILATFMSLHLTIKHCAVNNGQKRFKLSLFSWVRGFKKTGSRNIVPWTISLPFPFSTISFFFFQLTLFKLEVNKLFFWLFQCFDDSVRYLRVFAKGIRMMFPIREYWLSKYSVWKAQNVFK